MTIAAGVAFVLARTLDGRPLTTGANGASPMIRMRARHPFAPIARLAEPLASVPIVATRAALLPRLGVHALTRVANRLASVTAELGATGGSQVEIDAARAEAHHQTRCKVVARTMFVPRGFSEQAAIEDRITLEANYWDAEVTGVAEWAIAPGATAPQFSRAIGVAFLSHCPAPRP
ncbi:MAG: hypothetical protein ACRDHB_09850 [Actinomycetota bacterium]